MRLGPPPSGPDFSALAITRKEWDIEELEEDIKVLKELYGLSNGERANAN